MLILWKEILYYLHSAPNDLSSFLLEESQVGWKSATLKNLFKQRHPRISVFQRALILHYLRVHNSKRIVTLNAREGAQSLQSCPTCCNPTDHSLPRFSVHGILHAKYWSGFHSLLQGIFLMKGSNLGLLCCRQILYHWVTGEALQRDDIST